MNIYVVLTIWVIFWGIIANMTSKEVCVGNCVYENRVNTFMALMTFSFLIVMIGLRSGMADTAAYIKHFEELPDTYSQLTQVILKSDDAKGFYFFAGLIKVFISNDYHVWLFILSIINGVCVALTLKKYSSNFAISALLFILTGYFSWMYNGLKQFFVVCIMFSATDLILKKKIVPYMILVLFLTLFHKTALIFIPVYFIVTGEAWNKRTLLFIGFILIAIVFAGKFTNIFNDVVETTYYGKSMELFKYTDDGTNIIRVLVESVPTIIAFIYREKIKKISTPIIDLCINMSIMGTGIYIISVILSSGIMIGRLPIYFTIYNIILLPWLISNLFENNEKRLVYYIAIMCYFVYFYYQFFVTWKVTKYISDIFTLFN